MFGGRGFKLFRLSGFEVRLHSSWIILAALVVWSLAGGFFPYKFPGYTAGDYWLMALGGAIGLLFSIVVHEFAHSVVARHYGIPMNGITLFIFGGVAEMGDEPPNAKSEFLMAIAGPLMSVLVAICSFGISAALATSGMRGIAAVFYYLAWINAVLALFNIVPAFPLDGGRVLRAAIWAKTHDIVPATRIAAWIGSGFGFLLMLLGGWSIFRGNLIGGIWWVLIGMFVRGASDMSYKQVLHRRALEEARLQQLSDEYDPEPSAQYDVEPEHEHTH